MKLNWTKLIFIDRKLFNYKKKKNFIGTNIFALYRFNGRFLILNGLCLGINKKNFKLLTVSIIIKNKDNFFIQIPFYLSGALKLKILDLTYNYKIKSSKLFKIIKKK